MRLLSGADRLFGALVHLSDLLASVWILGLMVLVVSDVVMRFVFNAPIAGVNELMEVSIVAMLYMQVTQALRYDRHTRSTAFLSLIKARNPRAGHLMNAIFYLAGFALMVAILYGAVPGVVEAYTNDYTIGTRGVLLLPEWPIRLIIVYGCTLMALQFAISVADAYQARRADLHG